MVESLPFKQTYLGSSPGAPTNLSGIGGPYFIELSF